MTMTVAEARLLLSQGQSIQVGNTRVNQLPEDLDDDHSITINLVSVIHLLSVSQKIHLEG